MRDNSRFSRQGSSFRYNSRPGKGSNTGYGSSVKQGVTVNLWRDPKVNYLKKWRK